MKTFIEYLRNLSENAEKYNILYDLIKLSWTRYNPETKDFLEKIANKDAEIKRLLEKINNPNQDEKIDNDDDVYKSSADANFGNEEV